ncbi:UTP6 [Enterospora canceri]|uniref:UTP6 n=1 Tax=Enterospora canceri TaxID=1081671 RepID=A0A1Y1S4T4_9MICR|nr:UTP6 [Enterospora canceri]
MSSKSVYETVKRMTPELAGYKERKIFSGEEVQKIMEARKRYEMRLQRTKKNVADFINYVNSEMKLLKKRNKIIEKKSIMREDTDKMLETNILHIYMRGFRHFDDSKMFKQFGEFCVKHNFIEEMKSVFERQLLMHSKDVEYWLYCTRQFKQIEDIESARNTLLRGLDVVEDKNELYVEFFKTEVEYAAKLMRFNREMGVAEEDYGRVERGEIALDFFREIAANCTNVEVAQSLKISKTLPGLTQKIKAILHE